MALRQLILTKKIREKKKMLEQLRTEAAELTMREKELEKALEEAETEEDTGVVETEIEEYEIDKKKSNDDIAGLELEIKEIEAELDEVRSKMTSNEEPDEEKKKKKRERKEDEGMIRRGIFSGMNVNERTALVEREDVKEFLERARSFKGQTRSVSGAELLIPEVVLDLLKDNIDKYSKLIAHVRLKPVSGKARQNIAGTIPEGVWTEAIATLNELEISFNQVEVDGYKVGGYIPIPNSTLEDSDIDLAAEMIEGLGQAIGIAIDKAVLYGTGVKMPLGIVTRLAQATAPTNYPVNAQKWVALNTSNVLKLNIDALSGADFFAKLITGLGVAAENYSDGNKFWCMSSKTKNQLLAKAITFDAAGAIVSSAKDEMPVIGGKIETLPFMAEGEIVGGYGSLYLLAERKGGEFAVSDQVKFIEDVTVFKGTARYDGKPVIPEGFVAVTMKNVAVTTSVTFAADKVNATV
ncbi:MAG: phage major capsid protein [Flavobacterium sp.]